MVLKPRFCLISIAHLKRQLRISGSPSLTNDAQEHDRWRNGLRTSISSTESSRQLDARLINSSSSAIKISLKRGFLSEARQLQSHLIKLGCHNKLSTQSQIVHAYVNCGEFGDVCKLFDEIPIRNVISWNTVICGVAKGGPSLMLNHPFLGFECFRKMLLEMVMPDRVTMNGLLRICAELNNVRIGRVLHAFVVKLGFSSDRFVGGALVGLYGKCGLVGDARCIFDAIMSRDLVLWNVMVSCYSMNCLAAEAFGVFRLLQLEGEWGDEFTVTSLLSSCGTTKCRELGMQFQCVAIKLSFDLDVQVATALIDMYAKNQAVNDARKAFDGMAVRNLVSWNAMIVGYGQDGDGKEAMKLLLEMFRINLRPDELSLASILSSCGFLSSISEITLIHSYAMKSGFQAYLSIGNALIVAYSKCGSIAYASQCFILIQEPDLITWTSILSAYAFHGNAKESIKIFEMMLLAGVRPDDVAFLGVLSACSHAGLINEGLHYFKLMICDYHIMPNPEHYSCVVDLLGRAGLLPEAFSILTSVPIGFVSNTLAAFFGACKVHGHVKLAEWAAKRLFELEPNCPVNYALMSNIYASIGNWFDVARVRKKMKNECKHKLPGCSWIEHAGMAHTFVSSDTSHPLAEKMFAMVGLLIRLMKKDDCDWECEL